jgi:hypothetical protein
MRTNLLVDLTILLKPQDLTNAFSIHLVMLFQQSSIKSGDELAIEGVNSKLLVTDPLEYKNSSKSADDDSKISVNFDTRSGNFLNFKISQRLD